MTRDRTVASGSTIEEGAVIAVSPSRVPETGSGTTLSTEATWRNGHGRVRGTGTTVLFPAVDRWALSGSRGNHARAHDQENLER
jgi:hypothetical protein